jgi:hypothetical protein
MDGTHQPRQRTQLRRGNTPGSSQVTSHPSRWCPAAPSRTGRQVRYKAHGPLHLGSDRPEGHRARSSQLHFDRPIGDLANPRGFASHYTGWTLDLPARLVEHAAGHGARLMQVVGEAGIGWQLARIWPGTRARERSLKRSGGAARRCPVCQLAPLGLQPPRPVDPLALELGARVAACTATAPLFELLPAVAA